MKTWLLVFVNILLISVLWFNRDTLTAWLLEDNPLYFPLVFIIVILFAMFPIIPFGVIGGIIGAKYGVFGGAVINITASTLAAIIIYALAANILYDWGKRVLVNSSATNRLHTQIQKHLFWTILLGRMIPIVPAIIINVYAGIFKTRLTTFVAATLLGKIPAMLVFAYVGNGIWEQRTDWTAVILVYGVFLLGIAVIYRIIPSKK